MINNKCIQERLLQNFDWKLYITRTNLTHIETKEAAFQHWQKYGKYYDNLKASSSVVKYISLGSNCAPKLNMNLKYNHETFLFDWLITGEYPLNENDNNMWNNLTKNYSMKTVNTILQLDRFRTTDMTISDKDLNREENKCTIISTYFISIHDVAKNNIDVYEFVNKLNRRLDRFKLFIKNNNTIEFIRIEYMKFDIKDYEAFYTIIKNINNKINIKIHIVSISNYKPENTYDYLHIHTLNDNKIPIEEWTPFWNDFNWDIIIK